MPFDVAIPQEAKTILATSPKQRLEVVAQWFDRNANRHFKTLHRVEDMTPEVLRALSASGTLFESISGALLEAGVKVDNTVGSIMGALDLSQENVNYIACFCHNGDSTAGSHVAMGLRNVASYK